MSLTGIEQELHTPVAQPRRHGNKVVGLPGFEPGSMLPILESIIPGYALAMREALDAGDHDDLRRMLDLLAALGGPP